MKTIARLALIFALLLACSRSPTFLDRAANPTGLINGIKSYQSVAEAKELFESLGFNWRVIPDLVSSPGDTRPPFNIFAARVDGYGHLGHPGSLTVIFFNDRLLATWFYPEDPEVYLKTLKERGGIDLVSKAEATRPPFTKIWKYKDFELRFYVAWEDTRLAEEQRTWIERYF